MTRGSGLSGGVRAGAGHRSSLNGEPSLEDVRRMLEGRVEAIEAARARYAALESVLSGSRWKRRLRRSREVVQDVLGGEAGVAEALERIHRRAELEGWPESLAVLVTARDISARRARLVAFTRRRLESLAQSEGEASLAGDLPRLVDLVNAPLPLAPVAGEVCLLRQTTQDRKPEPPARLLGVFLGLSLLWCVLLSVLGGDAGTFVAVGLLVVQVLGLAAQSGNYWLTSERLVWKPLLGEAVEVPLRSIREGGVRVSPGWSRLRVEGARTLRMGLVPGAERLAACLELHRRPPLLGASRAGLRLDDAAVYAAVLREGGGARKGWGVLRPDSVAFFPEGTGPEVMRAVTGSPVPPGLRVELDWVLEQLLWLPAAEFDALVERVAVAVGGLRWSAWEARHAPGVPVWKDIRITHGEQVLSGKVGWAQQAPAEKALSAWGR
ncbi:hypothetical protein P2318_29170 [Myxococcaceae bacterium GXIMD 01537]